MTTKAYRFDHEEKGDRQCSNCKQSIDNPERHEKDELLFHFDQLVIVQSEENSLKGDQQFGGEIYDWVASLFLILVVIHVHEYQISERKHHQRDAGVSEVSVVYQDHG